MPFFQRLLSQGAEELPITHRAMTRFWITLQQGVEFVEKAFMRMQGGELFIPKIPSALVVDIAEALAPGMPLRDIGIRPGEKLHEIMCPKDDAHNTLEFPDHYVIRPTVPFRGDLDFGRNPLGEEGQPVPEGFEYNSANNPHVLCVEEIRALIRRHCEGETCPSLH